MVDLLCRGGNAEAAVRLERLWNDLAAKHSLSLFCAYVLDNFAGESSDQSCAYTEICATHTHAFYGSSAETHARLRRIGELEVRARALEADVQRRKDADAFRLLVTSVKDYAIFTLDPEGVVTSWNTGAARIKGYRADEIIGAHFSRFYPEGDIARGKCEMELEVAAREGRFEDEDWRIRKDGTRFWANVIITPVYDDAGTLLGFSKVTRDLTDRRRAEEERLQLARTVEANRVRDEFLATVSHELRSPLNAILGWATLLCSQTKDPYVTRAAETIARNARAQARLIDDLLDVSRIIGGKLRLEIGPVDLETVAREALESVRLSAEQKGLSVRLQSGEHPALLVADHTRLQQVVTNLLSNAVKFTPKGGSIAVAVEARDSTVRLTVRDDGCGIDPAFLPHVFERFRQADDTATRKSGGLGLGLAIVRHLVELHGGHVEAHSAGLGQGATFTVTLPLRAVAQRTREDDSSDDIPPTRLDGLSVLVIDDEADARELLCAMLQTRGAMVRSAASVAEAREELSRSLPSAIVSDIGMPGESGYDLVRSVREMRAPAGTRIPIIAVTAFASAHDGRRAREAGFDDHVPKPVIADGLAATIRRHAVG
jgi:PAS domain S-box-containing protein